ncbi:MAG: hypothetical protein ABH834_02940, partial [Candidatus Altiarchaeota archaeon]
LCQMFPFLIESVSYGDEIILNLAPAGLCPGYGRGDNLGDEFMERLELLGSQLTREASIGQRGIRGNMSFEEILSFFGDG